MEFPRIDLKQKLFGGIFMSDKKRLIKSVLTGAACGLLTSVIVLCVFAAVMMKIGLIDAEVLDCINAAFLGLGAVAGGFTAAKINKGAGLIAGPATGAVMLLAVTAVSGVQNKAEFSTVFLIKLLAALLGGALGGILAVRTIRN